MKPQLFIQPFVIATVAVITLSVISVLRISFPITVTTASPSTELAVVGEGKVDVVPDRASVDVGISVSNAESVAAAQAQVNKTNNAIISAMEKLGIDKKNIKTANYSVYPNYDYSEGQKITGYGADVRVTITTMNTQQMSEIVQAATEAGANNIYNTSFSVSDPAKYRKEAREKAIENAKQQAQEIANNLGIQLGKVTNIVESTGSLGGPQPVMMRNADGLGAGGAPAFEEGTQTISSTVTLYFQKK
ncbi:MAG: SIMPL domain-containing protein [Patescibacteria group bacterium]|nr:SIMPL domain-containing protein [Patescibacteria group bacterium]